jgi:anti-sigma factor ChrR (cupin superfamily)
MQPAFSTVILTPGLFDFAARPEQIAWRPFQPGVEIHHLFGSGQAGPSAALIRFHPGGTVPLHYHAGNEYILVLAGSQTDENGASSAGTLIVNPPGTQHSIVSHTGCVVLAIYEKPVAFITEPGAASGALPTAPTPE